MQSEALNLTVDPIERRIGIVAKDLGNCQEHGDFVAIRSRNSETLSGCPKCAEVAQRLKDAEDQKALMAKIAADRLANKLGAALIPSRFRDRSFEGYKATEPKQVKALTICREYAENFAEHFKAGRCLLLLGNVGTGKTHLATAIANHVMHTSTATAVYRTVGGILQHIKGSYDRESGYSEGDAFAAYTKPSLLIIDEVGATKPTEFELASLFNIINGRYEEQLPTVVISNLPAGELAGALGERCVDRLREGGGIAVGFDWVSARAKVKA
jgi:DNA replication protein DnaC